MIEEIKNQALLKEYAIGNTVTLGVWQGEALQWQVLGENGKMRLLLAKKNVAELPYNESYTDTSWRECSLRRWLNGEFLKGAFTAQERAKIMSVRVENPASPKYHTSGGFSSVDKLFCLSEGEIGKYLPDQERRDTGKWWWLRSPGISLLCAVSVDEEGAIYENGINIDYPSGGVRPAMWILLRG